MIKNKEISLRGRKIEIVLSSGETFQSITEFSAYIGKSLAAVSKALSRGETPDQLFKRVNGKAAKQAKTKQDLEVKKGRLEDALAKGGKFAEGYSTDYIVLPDGEVYNQKTDRYLKPTFCKVHTNGYDAGYWYLNVKKDTGEWVKTTLHTLVCVAHHGSKPDGLRMTVDHIDRDVSNNAASNLRWCEQKENNRNRGNHIYHTYKGKEMLLAEILESLGVERDSKDWWYLNQRVSVTGNTPEKALIALEKLRRTGKGATTGIPFELKSSKVTGVWFPSTKHLADAVGKSSATIRYRIEKGDTYEEIVDRFTK